MGQGSQETARSRDEGDPRGPDPADQWNPLSAAAVRVREAADRTGAAAPESQRRQAAHAAWRLDVISIASQEPLHAVAARFASLRASTIFARRSQNKSEPRQHGAVPAA